MAPNSPLNTVEALTLEALVDRHGLTRVLDALAIVASSKAALIRAHWRDAELARAWDRACAIVAIAAARTEKVVL